MKKKCIKSLKLHKTKVSNFDPNSPKGGSVYTSTPFRDGQIICKFSYIPGCNPESVLNIC
jgi:hypothetical protein